MNIWPANPTMVLPTQAARYARDLRCASSSTNSRCDHGWGKTASSIRSTPPRSLVRMGAMTTSTVPAVPALPAFPAAGVSSAVTGAGRSPDPRPGWGQADGSVAAPS